MKDLKKNNFLLIQDITSNEKNFQSNIYKYFYSLFKAKREFKSFLKYSQIFFEAIQFISYIFSPNHFNSWKLPQYKIITISNVIGVFRLSMIFQFLDYKIYSVIQYILLILIFLLCLVVLLQILFIESTSKKYKFFLLLIRSIIDIVAIIFYLPVTEILLLPIRCKEGKVYGIKNGEICWKNYHYLNAILGIIGSILLFIWSIFMINFSFYPFQKQKSNIRINSNNDIFIIIMKLILILQYLLISNEYISLTILIIISIVLFFNCYNNHTYNMMKLEAAINIKNLLIMWSYFVLLLSKIFKNTNVNGFIYLLIYGYPLNIYLAIVICQEREYHDIGFTENINNPKEYIQKAQNNISLINSFIKINRNMRNGNENIEQKNIILLKGNIEFHNMVCNDSDCPLNKFLISEGNFNAQRQCLLNYMNHFFNLGFKKFPNNIYLLLLYIQFNYGNRFNLNSVKTNFIKLKKIKCSIKESFIIYCMEQNINDLNNNGNNYNEDIDCQEDLNEQKYQKLKFLIENSIKLYAEFWGIFSTNITSIINTTKLYSLGKKLNIYLNEINNLWDNELKNKKISNECQNIAQLYSKFLLEILWDRKKSRDISKKINDENMRSHLNETKKDKEGKNNNLASIESLIDNQEYLLFCDSDEKGNSKIIQCSASFSQLLGYQKYDMIGKPLEMIFPNILIEENLKYLEECIKSLHNKENDQKELYQENDSNKNRKLLIVKNKMGYIIPLFASFYFIDDNDYSDSFLIKIKIERRESKSEYAYYVLTTHDLIIENIASSAIHLGLTLDLLKKYMVKMDVLIRTETEKGLNLYENSGKYEDESKIITWIFPYLIYPKDNNQQIREEEMEDLVLKSQKKQFYLQIRTIKYNNVNNLAFVFKFTEISIRRRNKKLNEETYIPSSNKNLVMFDLLNLTYIRALLVKNKTGLRNLRNVDVESIDKNKIESNISNVKKSKKRKKNNSMAEEENESSDDSEKKKGKNILTREKIIELQVNSCSEIKEFIFSLPIYGRDIALERFRPNGDKYSASKITEPSIKIQVIHFTKRIDEKIHLYQNLKKRKNKSLSQNDNIEYQNSSNANNYLVSTDSNINASSSIDISRQNSDYHREEINKGLVPESSSSLSNIFKSNTINSIKILIAFTFFMTFLFLIVEFIITYRQMNKLKNKVNYLYNSFKAMTNILYTKFYVTEAILANTLNADYVPVLYMGLEYFLNDVIKELTLCREGFAEFFDIFTSNDLCQEYNEFMANKKINISTLSINKQETLEILFNNAMTRVPAAINDLISSPYTIKIDNRDAFELMHNLINEYYINWEKVIEILYDDCIKATTLKLPLKIIIIIYVIISVIIFFILLNLLSKFSFDREKPINLFLTLKKQVFENLKTSAENFSNKILNKFFGNEEKEEESQQDYQANIQPNDINIVKFKSANEHNYSIKKALSFIVVIIIIFVFLLVYLIYFVLKYFFFRQKMNNIYNYILIFTKTNVAQNDYILCFDIFKSYLFNKSIPILNKKDTKTLFIENFLNVTNKFEDSIIINSKADSFLSGEYLQKYGQYLYGDFGELLGNDFYEKHKNLLDTIQNGLKPIQIRFSEIIRYYTIKYCDNYNLYDKGDEISFILKEKEFKLYEINILVQLIMKMWYNNVLILMVDNFFEYVDNNNLTYIIILIILIIVVILYYCIIWIPYEEKLNVLLKGSSDLINLIPQEIKNIMIEKINE